MPLRLTDDEERPFAPFALLLAALVAGLVIADLLYWSKVPDHRPEIAHTPEFGVILLIMWLWLAWASQNLWLRSAWQVLAFNEVLSIFAGVHPDLLPWWRRDVLVFVWTFLVAVWGWRHSPVWARVVGVLLFLTGVGVGQSMLTVPRRAPIVRTGGLVKPK